jgi:uncharacterized protein (DUF427 family)
MSTNDGPGYKKHPDHRVATKPAGVRVRVTFNGEVIADSRDAVRLDEAEYPAVYYIPRKGVKMERLARSSHQSYCPFKGHASYYSLVNGPENAVWTYEQPYDEMTAIKELLAFYPDKVDSISASHEWVGATFRLSGLPPVPPGFRLHCSLMGQDKRRRKTRTDC